MSSQQQRQFGIMVGGNINSNNVGLIDTTYTKIFVGGLAWETQRDTMRRYFEQFGEIQEAVVITDKNTGRSKGYGFVTFKDPDSAVRACQDPSPVIDGRRANCNLACLGAQRPHPLSASQHGLGRFRPGHGSVVTAPAYDGSSAASTYFNQPSPYTFPYSTYGYSGYSQENMYQMNYYNVYGGQQIPAAAYYAAGGAASGTPGIVPNFYPFYMQNGQAQGLRVQYPQWVQYPYISQPYTPAVLPIPTPVSPVTTITGVTLTTEGSVGTRTITIKDPGSARTEQSST